MNNILLIRVQQNLHDAFTDNDNNLIIPKKPNSDRNTIHFSLNTVVSDHVYGSFNHDSDGNFKGQVVIISPISEVKATPSGFNQVDTWFRYGSIKKQNPNNSELESEIQGINLGKATLVLPIGTPTPNIENINIVHYDGTIEDRNLKISEIFKKQNIKEQECGYRNWNGYDMQSSLQWNETISQQLYPHTHQFIHKSMHDGSIDSKIERISLTYLLDKIKTDEIRYIRNYALTDVEIISEMKSNLDSSTITINQFLNQLEPQEKSRVQSFYMKKQETLQKEYNEALLLDLPKKITEISNDIASLIDDLNGQGNFFLQPVNNNPNNLNSPPPPPIEINSQNLTKKLINGEITTDCLVWRQGLKTDWQPIASFKILNSSIIELNESKLLLDSINPKIKNNDEITYLSQKNTIHTNQNPNIDEKYSFNLKALNQYRQTAQITASIKPK